MFVSVFTSVIGFVAFFSVSVRRREFGRAKREILDGVWSQCGDRFRGVRNVYQVIGFTEVRTVRKCRVNVTELHLIRHLLVLDDRIFFQI